MTFTNRHSFDGEEKGTIFCNSSPHMKRRWPSALLFMVPTILFVSIPVAFSAAAPVKCTQGLQWCASYNKCINPKTSRCPTPDPVTERFVASRNAQRVADVRHLLYAIYGYLKDHHYSAPVAFPTRQTNICPKVPSTCKGIPLPFLVKSYIRSIPYDPLQKQNGPNYVYSVFRRGSILRVSAPFAEATKISQELDMKR